MAFNGSGTFNRLYSWVQDAANGVNIDSTRMDNEMNGMATGLTDCVTRDGQSPFTADLPAGGFKITGLGLGVAGTDAANVNNITAIAANQWIVELNTVAWVSTTSFKVTGIDVTATYTAGRRLKIVHNTGGTTSYAAIVSATFSTDTTVVVATDTGAVLVSTVTAVSYGLLTYTNPSYLDPRTAICAVPSTGAVMSAGVEAKIVLGTEVSDPTSEFASNRFTAKHPGYYMVSFMLSCVAITGSFINLSIRKNGASDIGVAEVTFAANANPQFLPVFTLALLAVGDYIEAWMTPQHDVTIISSGSGSPPYDTQLIVARLV